MQLSQYSIGSLADLISGINTPNKPSVIEQEYKPTPKIEQKFEESTQQRKLSKKKEKKRKVADTATETNEDEADVNSKKKKKSKNQTVEQHEQFIVEPASDIVKTSKNKHKKRKGSITENDETDVSEETSNKKKKKVKDSDEPSTELATFEDNIEITKKAEKKKKKADASYADNAQRRVEEKHQEEVKPQLDPERENRTVFVGNLPKTIKKIKITKLFKQFGTVEAVRIRSIAIANPKVPKRVAICKNELHPDRNSVNAFVRFTDRESAIKGLALNGTELQKHHLRVKLVVEDNENKSDSADHAVFLGNVSFRAEDDDIWNLFSCCGEIESVRLIRDARTNIGKGFGYINFKSKDAVELALQMGEVKLDNRPLRISRNKKLKRDAQGKKNRTFRVNAHNNSGDGDENGRETQDDESKKPKRDKPAAVMQSTYAGTKVAEKKKKKTNKGDLKKKRIIKQLLPKSQLSS